MSELVHRCDVVYHLAAAVGVRLIVEQPGRTLADERPGRRERARVLRPVREAGPGRLELGGLRQPPRGRARSPRTRGGSTGRRPRSGGRTRTRRRSTSSSRSRSSRSGPPLRDRPALQHRRPAPEQPVRNVVPRFVQRALAGEPLEIHGDGSQTRCFCHVSDVGAALAGCWRPPTARSTTSGRRSGSRSGSSRSGCSRRRARARSSSSCPTSEVYEGGVAEEMFHRAPGDRQDRGRDRLAARRSSSTKSWRTSSRNTRRTQAPSPT